MKIGFVVTTHFSKNLRPNGREIINSYISTLEKSFKKEYKIFIIDNGSSEIMDISKYKNIDYTFIEDQTKLGITGAWNIGIKKAIDDNCDIILNTNDDIEFNETINNMIKVIAEHKYNDTSIYGPVTFFGGCPGPNKQERKEKGSRILEVTETSKNSWNNGHGINGFFNAFTKECFFKFNTKDNLYSTEEKYKIAGQESEMQLRLGKKGLKSFIIEECIVFHNKIRGWKQLI